MSQLLASPGKACLVGAVMGLSGSLAANADGTVSLQEQIRSEPTYPQLRNAAYKLLAGGYNAGSNYPEIWIRDLNTFLLPSLDVNPASMLRQNLLSMLSLL